MLIRLVCLFLWLAGVQAHALELAGVSVEPRVRVGAQALSLNGAGIRSKFMFKVYVAALYVATPADKVAQLIDQPGAKRIQLTLLRDVDVDRLLDGMREGFKRNLSVEENAALHDTIERFSALFRAAGDGHQGDRIALDWIPTQGTVVRINDSVRGHPLSGEAFYRALLRIWLGDHPAQESLREALLGRKA